MALTGELSDLSLSELIEFFCNQRKTGRLKVIYPHLPGYFYIQAGSLIDARIGSLSGIEAVYYALTLPNASFKFDQELEAEGRTIHQPWTQVVLEGLRRMDEGITPDPPSNKDELPDETDLEEALDSVIAKSEDEESSTGPMALTVESMNGAGGKRKRIFASVAAAILIAVGAGFVIVNRMARVESTASIPPVAVRDVMDNSANASDNGATDADTQQLAEAGTTDQSLAEGAAPDGDQAALWKEQREREARERERRRALEERAYASSTKTAEATSASTTMTTPAAVASKKPDAPKAGPKTVTVQVTYDEAGRVTQASGSDPTALRIARQKRFPSGKPGTTTVTIPIN